MITEENIVGFQNVYGVGPAPDYNHKHVLRDILNSDYKGEVILTAGNPITNTQVVINDYTIPTDWDVDNCHIIAFVHNRSATNLEIHQAIEVDLVP